MNKFVYEMSNSELKLLEDIFQNPYYSEYIMSMSPFGNYCIDQHAFTTTSLIVWKNQYEGIKIDAFVVDHCIDIRMQDIESLKILPINIDFRSFGQSTGIYELQKLTCIEVYRRKFEYEGHVFEFDMMLKLINKERSILIEPFLGGNLPYLRIIIDEAKINDKVALYSSQLFLHRSINLK
jgi:hypothetical protein